MSYFDKILDAQRDKVEAALAARKTFEEAGSDDKALCEDYRKKRLAAYMNFKNILPEIKTGVWPNG